MLGLPDRFIQQGDQAALLASVGLDAHGIARAIRRRFDVTEPRLVVNRR
jgi:1-deoxy-D-xylulose-5-phosphate synthase